MNNFLNRIGNSKFGRALGKKYRKKGTIICYHRVMPHLEVSRDKNPGRGLAISDKCFDLHLNHLSKNYNVISMDQMQDHILSDSDEYFVSITFDDGYNDNMKNALPILERYDLPATIYIVTKHPEGKGSIWWYELEDYVMNNDHIDFSFDKFSFSSHLKTLKDKYYCFDSLRNFIINKDGSTQKLFLEKLTKNKERKDYSSIMLGWEGIKYLDKHPLITIGAHTHTHPNLKCLKESDAIDEIKYSKRLLEKKLGHSIEHFAYPFGSDDQVGDRVSNYPRKIGFKTAVSTDDGFVESNELFLIKRICLGWLSSVNELESKLNGFSKVL